jgi:hypothetical protein
VSVAHVKAATLARLPLIASWRVFSDEVARRVNRRNEIVLAIVSALTGAGLAYSARMGLGGSPSPVVYYSLIIIGLGAALVVIRYGRLGPFQGEFGSPTLENRLREEIVRETERATRYGRAFTLVAVRQTGGKPVQWSSAVRRVDDVVSCRRDFHMLFLPETSPDGALDLLRRARELYSATLDAAIVSCPEDGRSGDDLALRILDAVRTARQPNQVLIRRGDQLDSLPLVV